MISEGLRAFNWITDRIDQASKFLKKKGRINEVNKIESAVDGGDDKSVNSVLRHIVKESSDRRKANS